MQYFGSHRFGKTAAMIEETKKAQGEGKRVVWATHDQAETAQLLSRHGAFSVIEGEHHVVPYFTSRRQS